MSPSPRLDVGLAGLAPDFDLILCDVWGVVHNGVAHHPTAVDALRRYRQGGGRVVLVTNAPAPASLVRRRLDRLAVPRDAYDAIATSGDVTIGMIVAAGCPPLFSIGPGGEYAIYTEAARLGPRAPALVPIAEAEIAICIGLDETGERPEDYHASLAALRGRDLELVCANPDIVVEVGDTLYFCAGAIAARYEALGRPRHAGGQAVRGDLRAGARPGRHRPAAGPRAGDRRCAAHRHRRRRAHGLRLADDHLGHPPRRAARRRSRGGTRRRRAANADGGEGRDPPGHAAPQLVW